MSSCSQCRAPYDPDEHRPKALPCGHSICLTCVRGLNKVECPVDNQIFKSKGNALPDNYALLEMAKLRDEKPAVAPQLTPRRFWCTDCGAVAKDECLDEHAIISLRKMRLQRAQAPLAAVRDGETAVRDLRAELVATEQALQADLTISRGILDDEMLGLDLWRQCLEAAIESEEAVFEQATRPTGIDRLAADAGRFLAALGDAASSELSLVLPGPAGGAWMAKLRHDQRPAARLLLCQLLCSGQLVWVKHYQRIKDQLADKVPSLVNAAATFTTAATATTATTSSAASTCLASAATASASSVPSAINPIINHVPASSLGSSAPNVTPTVLPVTASPVTTRCSVTRIRSMVSSPISTIISSGPFPFPAASLAAATSSPSDSRTTSVDGTVSTAASPAVATPSGGSTGTSPGAEVVTTGPANPHLAVTSSVTATTPSVVASVGTALSTSVAAAISSLAITTQPACKATPAAASTPAAVISSTASTPIASPTLADAAAASLPPVPKAIPLTPYGKNTPEARGTSKGSTSSKSSTPEVTSTTATPTVATKRAASSHDPAAKPPPCKRKCVAEDTASPAWEEVNNGVELDNEAMAQRMVVGSRVARGLHWPEFSKVDGKFEQGEGTVVTRNAAAGTAVVLWDASGKRVKHCMGKQEKWQTEGPGRSRHTISWRYELTLLPSDSDHMLDLDDGGHAYFDARAATWKKERQELLATDRLDYVRFLSLRCDTVPSWSKRVLQRVAPRLEALRLEAPDATHLRVVKNMPVLRDLFLSSVDKETLELALSISGLVSLEAHCSFEKPLSGLTVLPNASLNWLCLGIYPLRAALAVIRAHAATLETLELVAASFEPYGCPDLAAELMRCDLKALRNLELRRESNVHFCRHEVDSCESQVQHLTDMFLSCGLTVTVWCTLCCQLSGVVAN